MNLPSYSRATLEYVSVRGRADQAWKDIADVCPHLTSDGVRLLREGLDPILGSVMIEPEYICKDFRNLNSHFYSKKFVQRPNVCHRLHFFLCESDKLLENTDSLEELQEYYIGFSIVQPVNPLCVGRTVIDPFKCNSDPAVFHFLSSKYTSHVNGQTFQTRGYPYISQSAEAMVCAHAALWGLCRHLSNSYSNYGEVYPHDLIAMTGDAAGRRVPYRGMSYSDYSTILSKFGSHPVIIHPRNIWSEDIDAYHDIYAYLESGIPILVSFKGHVVTLVGHTASDSLLPGHVADPETGFHNSYALLKQYVVVDDNFFPYQLLGYSSDAENYGQIYSGQLAPSRDPSMEFIHAAVAPLPEKAYLEPKNARDFAHRFFKYGTQGRSELDRVLKELEIDSSEPLLSRLFMVSSIAFKRRKLECVKGELGEKDELSRFSVDVNLPHFVWVMEVSPLCLHRERKCTAEIVLDASATPNERPMVYARVGNSVFVNGKTNRFSTSPTAFIHYTSNLGRRYQ